MRTYIPSGIQLSFVRFCRFSMFVLIADDDATCDE